MSNEDSSRPVPLLGDISLEYISSIKHSIEGGFISARIPGLDGEVHQRNGRPSHRIFIEGVLFGEEVSENLETLQTAAQTGEELTFSADITTALDIAHVIINRFEVYETAGRPNYYTYSLSLTESPPLPPPAEVSGFGGLDGFGFGDLGFDTDIMGDLTDLAGDIAGALDGAMNLLDQLGALADLDGLSVDGILQPIQNVADNLSPIADQLGAGMSNLTELFS
ncbi:hypothetical protein [Desulfobacterium sp. N47]|uniref:DNA circulation N-terminal domain-containing protein n=1 Tax=uncultured Desulfobacterium sp. TaxID=201089 RepID=E1YEM0_9BACT|nr:hypothetical protein N47_P17190 [uncultured Desulfobacterium sp.]